MAKYVIMGYNEGGKRIRWIPSAQQEIE